MKLRLLIGIILVPAALAQVFGYREIASRAGLIHPFPNGGTEAKQYIIETTGSGVAFVDYDNDDRLDAFVISGDGGRSRLYRNLGNGRFQDVSENAGITRTGWGQGACAGDYDNDGYTDLFVTYWGQNVLYKNERGKQFRDVTQQSGLLQARTRYNTGCAFLDYDRDGRLDLFVANYVQFSFEHTPKPGANPYCWYLGLPVNCGPRGLPFDRNILYHAEGESGRFVDVSEQTGIAEPKQSYCLGVLTADFDGDAWPDVFVACDQTPSLLYINQRNGTFQEEAVLRGVAFDEDGKALSGMGATASDYLHTGWLSIFRTNFSDERHTLYRNRRSGEFEDATVASGVGQNTRFVGWGCAFIDMDNDGWKDVVLVNGHVFPEVDRKQLDIRFRDRRLVYRNLGNGKFKDVSNAAGPGIEERHSSRGLAIGDIDNDGGLDLLINNQGEPPSLLQAISAPTTGNWVLLRLEGVQSNRSGIGAKVLLTVGGTTQTDEVRSGGSYLSHSDLRVHFGVGKAIRVDRLEVTWPSGAHQLWKNLGVNRVHLLKETSDRAAAPAGAAMN